MDCRIFAKRERVSLSKSLSAGVPPQGWTGGARAPDYAAEYNVHGTSLELREGIRVTELNALDRNRRTRHMALVVRFLLTPKSLAIAR